MRIEHWISYRYLLASKGKFLTFLNFISIAGIAIGVAALIIVIGVMTGFGNNLRDKIIGTTPHISVAKENGIQDYLSLSNQLQTIDQVEGVAPFIQGNIFLKVGESARGLVFRAIDPDKELSVTNPAKYLVKGSFADLKPGTVIIGEELARFYGYQLGDQLGFITPSAGISGHDWQNKLTIVGIFNSGMIDFDTNLILFHLQTGKDISFLGEDIVSGLGVKINDPQHAEAIQKKVQELIGFRFLIRTWIDMNKNLFDALFLEKWGLFIILLLMVLVASFNVISTLIVTVTSKVHDIGILKSLGLSKGSIQTIFMRQGMFIGVMGILWGLFFGLVISYLLANYFPVPEQIYSIDRVPVDITLFDVLTIVCSAIIIVFLATLYPSSRAAKLEPVEALRYE